MSKNNPLRIPTLGHCNGRGYVELSGRRHYLGPTNAAETKEAYDRLIAVWLSNGRRLPTAPEETTVVELCRDYWAYCKEYFTKEDGSTTSSLFRIKQALKPLKALYGRTAASEFGPNALRTIRGKWLDQGLARKTINDYTSDIRRVFKWGASHELVPASIYQSLATVEGLRAGRSEAKETVPVRPVPEAHVRAVKLYVSRQVWGLIRLQILSAARPGEVVKLRPIDLDTSGGVWTAVLEDHKTRYRGRERTLYFGPKAPGGAQGVHGGPAAERLSVLPN